MLRRLKNMSKETRHRFPMLSKPNLRVSGLLIKQHCLHFLLRMSTTITCIFVISNFLSLWFFCFLLVNAVKAAPHFGQLSSSQVNVLGHFPVNWRVSAASYSDTNLSTVVSGILQFFSRYSAVLLRYFWDRPQSNLCCSQSSSWKLWCQKENKLVYVF